MQLSRKIEKLPINSFIDSTRFFFLLRSYQMAGSSPSRRRPATLGHWCPAFLNAPRAVVDTALLPSQAMIVKRASSLSRVLTVQRACWSRRDARESRWFCHGHHDAFQQISVSPGMVFVSSTDDAPIFSFPLLTTVPATLGPSTESDASHIPYHERCGLGRNANSWPRDGGRSVVP